MLFAFFVVVWFCQSDTAALSIPEIELELSEGTLGGKYTTIEGILDDIKNQLSRSNQFALGDSAEPEQNNEMTGFLAKLDQCRNVEKPFTLILDDPLGNVYIYSPLGLDDPNLKILKYDRTFEQNEELGLNDICVDPEQYANEEDLKEFHRVQQTDEEIARRKEEDRKQEVELLEDERKKNSEEWKSKEGGKIKQHDVEPMPSSEWELNGKTGGRIKT